MKYLLCLFLSLFSFLICTAQDYRITVTPEFAVPIGKLKWAYKSSAGASVTFSLVDINKRKKINQYYGVSLGYLSMKPLSDTLYYVVDKGAGNGGAGVGRAVFSPFQMFSLRLSSDWEIGITKQLWITAGAALGVMQAKRTMSFTDDFGGDTSSSENVQWGTFTPRMGISYHISDSFSISPFISYTAMIELGSTNEDALNYNPDTGSFNHFISANVAIHYSF